MAQNIWPKRQGTTSANMRQLRINIERQYKQRFECSFICLGAKCGIESLVTGHRNLCNGILKQSQANNYLILPDNEPRFCDVDGYFHTCDDFTKLLLPQRFLNGIKLTCMKFQFSMEERKLPIFFHIIVFFRARKKTR